MVIREKAKDFLAWGKLMEDRRLALIEAGMEDAYTRHGPTSHEPNGRHYDCGLSWCENCWYHPQSFWSPGWRPFAKAPKAQPDSREKLTQWREAKREKAGGPLQLDLFA